MRVVFFGQVQSLEHIVGLPSLGPCRRMVGQDKAHQNVVGRTVGSVRARLEEPRAVVGVAGGVGGLVGYEFEVFEGVVHLVGVVVEEEGGVSGADFKVLDTRLHKHEHVYGHIQCPCSEQFLHRRVPLRLEDGIDMNIRGVGQVDFSLVNELHHAGGGEALGS